MAQWRANIGLISPAQSVGEAAFNRYAPRGVEIATTRIRMKARPDEPDDGFLPRLESAAELFRDVHKDIIVFGCTIGSCIKGIGWDKECIRMMEEKSLTRCTTTINACMDAFKALGVKKIAMLTPYEEHKTKLEKEFLESSGYEVVDTGILDPAPFDGDVPQGVIYKEVKKMELSRADAVFISCMALYTMEVLELLERDLNLPVISSHQASLWSALRICGVNDKIPGLGKLMLL